MGSVLKEISRLETAKQDIETAIEYCGVDVPDTELIDTYANYIKQIPSAVFSELNVNPIGGNDTYIKTVGQTNGLITATTGGLVSITSSGLVPKANAAEGTIDSQDDWVLTKNGSSVQWYKLPVNAFANTTYSFTNGTQGNFTVTPLGGTEQTISIGKPTAAGTADAAIKLNTKRKLWGQDFDGTANVSGSLTGVTSINMNGDIVINDGTNHDRYIKWQYNNTDNYGWRIGYLGSKGVDDNDLTFDSHRKSEGWASALYFKHTTLDAHFAGQVIAPKFVGTLNNTLTFSVGPFSAKTYNNSKAIAVNIPTHTSHLTNNSGFVTGGPYLPTAGGTLTGPLTFANGVWNVVGDDAAIGDYNAAGMLGIKSCNNAIPGIGFHNSSNTLLGRLQVNEGTLLWNDYTVLHSNNSSVSGGGSSWGSSISVTINGTTSTLKIPSKPSVGNGTVTIKQEGTSKGSFTMNQSSATTIELTDTWRPITDSYSGTVTTTSLSQKGANDLYNAVIGSIPTVNNGKITIKQNDTEIGSFTMNQSGASTIELTDTTYGLVGASGTIGLIKNQSTVTSATGYTACPIINGVPYYQNTTLGNSGVTAGTYTPTPKTIINSTHQSIQVPELAINAQGLITKASLKNVPITGSFYIASNKTLSNSNLSFITSIAIAPGYTVTFPTPSDSNEGKIIFVKAAYGNSARYVSGKIATCNSICSTASTTTIDIGYYSHIFVCMDYGSGFAWVDYYCG